MPTTTRSGTVVCSAGCRAGTPSTSRVEPPTPPMRAPMVMSRWHRSTISGSRAALSITVVPVARTAAISRFSVAPTLGKSSQIGAPTSPDGALATM